MPAFSLLHDRRVVTQEVLDLITDHCAFKSEVFWDTNTKAGVRPALQEHMLRLKQDEEYGAGPQPRGRVCGLGQGVEALSQAAQPHAERQVCPGGPRDDHSDAQVV